MKNKKMKNKFTLKGTMAVSALVTMLAVGLLVSRPVAAYEGSLLDSLDELLVKVQSLLIGVKELKNELATLPPTIKESEANLSSSNNIQQGVPSILGTDSGYGVRATDLSGTPKDLVNGLFWTAMPAVGVNTSTAYMTNNTGRAVLLDLTKFHIQFAGTVSSSVATECATSTLNGNTSYTTRLTTPFLHLTTLTTSTVLAADVGTVMPTTTKKLAYLPNGSSVVCRWAATQGDGCNGAGCESVSSSARGYTANVFAPWLYAADPQM